MHASSYGGIGMSRNRNYCLYSSRRGNNMLRASNSAAGNRSRAVWHHNLKRRALVIADGAAESDGEACRKYILQYYLAVAGARAS